MSNNNISENGNIRCNAFRKAVNEILFPLLKQYGLLYTNSTECSFEYCSSSVVIFISYDTYSMEIYVRFALTSCPSEEFDLRDLHNLVNANCPDERTFFQSSTPSGIEYCIKAISELLKKYDEIVLLGDVNAFARMEEIRRKEFHFLNYEKPLKDAAERAWKNRDYVKVRDIYEKLGDNLTPVERGRLKYAKSKIDN